MIEITLLGTGTPLPDPQRAGPATLVRAGSKTFLIDAGRGVVMRAAAAGSGPNQLTAVLLTHLHSDHITDLGDLVTTRWITSFERSPLIVVGPVGTQAVTTGIMQSLSADIDYRTTHHADLDGPPPLHVREVAPGVVWDDGDVVVRAAATDHRPVDPTLAFRIEPGAQSRLSTVSGLTVLTLGDLADLPKLLRRVHR